MRTISEFFNCRILIVKKFYKSSGAIRPAISNRHQTQGSKIWITATSYGSIYRTNVVSESQYSSEYRDITGDEAQEKVVLTGVDTNTVTTGVFDVNNILIHVMQNLVNFLAGTAVWGVLGAMNIGGSSTGRSGRALGTEGITAGDFSWILRKIADTSDIIASMHEEL